MLFKIKCLICNKIIWQKTAYKLEKCDCGLFDIDDAQLNYGMKEGLENINNTLIYRERLGRIIREHPIDFKVTEHCCQKFNE